MQYRVDCTVEFPSTPHQSWGSTAAQLCWHLLPTLLYGIELHIKLLCQIFATYLSFVYNWATGKLRKKWRRNMYLNNFKYNTLVTAMNTSTMCANLLSLWPQRLQQPPCCCSCWLALPGCSVKVSALVKRVAQSSASSGAIVPASCIVPIFIPSREMTLSGKEVVGLVNKGSWCCWYWPWGCDGFAHFLKKWRKRTTITARRMRTPTQIQSSAMSLQCTNVQTEMLYLNYIVDIFV